MGMCVKVLFALCSFWIPAAQDLTEFPGYFLLLQSFSKFALPFIIYEL